MPISPKHFIDNTKLIIDSIVKQQCEKIDKDLTNAGTAIFSGVNAYTGPNSKHIQTVIAIEIRELYNIAGWEVTTFEEYSGSEIDEYNHEELCCLVIYLPGDKILSQLQSK